MRGVRKITTTIVLLVTAVLFFVVGWTWHIFDSKTSGLVRSAMIRSALGGAAVAAISFITGIFIVMYWLGFRLVRMNQDD